MSKTNSVVTVTMPLTIRRRGGRKLVLSPAGEQINAPARQRIDNTLVKALARAFRWRKLLETGAYATVAEMADAEHINRSYVSRVLRLTLLAPTLIEGILDGSVGAELVMPDLLEARSELWTEQQLAMED